MHRDAVVERRGCDIVAREPHMVGIALDRVDRRVGRAGSERQRRIAERGTKFQDAARTGGGCQRGKQRAVVVRMGAAAMLRAMRFGRGADFGEWIGCRAGHLCPSFGSGNSGFRA